MVAEGKIAMSVKLIVDAKAPYADEGPVMLRKTLHCRHFVRSASHQAIKLRLEDSIYPATNGFARGEYEVVGIGNRARDSASVCYA